MRGGTSMFSPSNFVIPAKVMFWLMVFLVMVIYLQAMIHQDVKKQRGSVEGDMRIGGDRTGRRYAASQSDVRRGPIGRASSVYGERLLHLSVHAESEGEPNLQRLPIRKGGVLRSEEYEEVARRSLLYHEATRHISARPFFYSQFIALHFTKFRRCFSISVFAWNATTIRR